MRHSVFPGGKRIRPGLALLGFETAGGKGAAGAQVGAAIELLHTFSLIHDDLPCMDDDDLRRGRPTCHAKFGEAIAVLAGDALQVLAFGALAGLSVPPPVRVRVLAEITNAVGTGGVIGGQVVDIESEDRRIRPATLRWIHAKKTGELLRASLVSGGLAGGADGRLLRRMQEFGVRFGLLFQIVDDLLDVVGTSHVLGRDPGRDQVNGKATYPSILGLDRTRKELQASVAACRDAVPAGRLALYYESLIEAVAGRLPEDWTDPLGIRVRRSPAPDAARGARNGTGRSGR
ncbi:MAG: polyprenyl synthetase family protein [Candidatus Eisenbacteria bacterium]|uniref:Polyprenyl synthetase family protein n=1 Tax=Eiseniibacteriota bacterium TaxID=2212470 RepID=A0A956LYN6_UNCEI|nr:polyprenyl synthetase family protein [Candidatus Eisenbacteria bacterium]